MYKIKKIKIVLSIILLIICLGLFYKIMPPLTAKGRIQQLSEDMQQIENKKWSAYYSDSVRFIQSNRQKVDYSVVVSAIKQKNAIDSTQMTPICYNHDVLNELK